MLVCGFGGWVGVDQGTCIEPWNSHSMRYFSASLRNCMEFHLDTFPLSLFFGC